VLKGVVHTVRAFEIDPELFDRFLRSMAMDLTVTSYATYDDLRGYMDGSAAVIGEMMLPVLEPLSADAVAPARALGEAFQLTNFLRDVGEDLDRGRVYLPREDLDRFGADPWRRTVDEPWRALARYEIERCRALYDEASAGDELLPPASARCIRAARVLYGEILDRIEANGYDVFGQRARVPRRRKARIVARALRG
jgi:phytoene synthase